MPLLSRNKIFILASVIATSSAGASAEPLPDHVPIARSYGTGLVVAPLYTREQCEEILLPIAEPNVIIAKGLRALDASARAETAGCLSEVVNLWEKAAPELAPDPRQNIGDDYLQDPSFVALRERQKKLSDEIDCTLPADPTEHERFTNGRAFLCKDGFFPRETLAAKTQEDKELKAKMQFAEASGQVRQSFAAISAELLVPHPHESSALKSLRLQVRCFEMPKLAECVAANVAAETIEALKKSLAEESDKFVAEVNLRQRRRAVLQDFLSIEGENDPRLDRTELASLHERFRCLDSGRYPPLL